MNPSHLSLYIIIADIQEMINICGLIISSIIPVETFIDSCPYYEIASNYSPWDHFVPSKYHVLCEESSCLSGEFNFLILPFSYYHLPCLFHLIVSSNFNVII